MTVGELIEKLQQYDPSLVVTAYDGRDPSDRTEVFRVVADGPFDWIDNHINFHRNSDRAIFLETL